MKRVRLIVLVVGLLLVAPALYAGNLTFYLAWTGDANPATATGQLVVDAQTWANMITFSTSHNDDYLSSNFVSFSVTISGASSGNGTFTLPDFSDFAVWGAGANFNYSQNLVGQAAGDSYWGNPDANSGDFNAFDSALGASASAPDGVWFFVLGADDGTQDNLLLTNFTLTSGTPVSAPEPCTLALVSLGGLALLGLKKRW
jgi:hypothetical protein